MAQARQDLHAIYAFIACDNPVAARRWVGKLRARATAAATAPMAGRTVPEVEQRNIREVFVGSYRLIYQVVGNELHVLTVFEGHRLFPADAVRDDERDDG